MDLRSIFKRPSSVESGPRGPGIRRARSLQTLTISLALTALDSSGQTTTPAPAPSPATVETTPATTAPIDARITEIEANTSLDESTRTRAMEMLRLAKTRLDSVRSNKDAAEAFRTAIQEAPAQAQVLRDSTTEEELIPNLENLSIEALEGQYNQLEMELSSRRSDRNELDTAIKDLKDRPTAARMELSEAQTKLDEIDRDLRTPAPADESPVLTESRKTALEARRQWRTSQVEMLEQELASQPARLALAEVQALKLDEQIAAIETTVQSAQVKLADLRRSAASAAQDEVERQRLEARNKHPLIRGVLDQNLQIVTNLTQVVELTEAARQQRTEMAARIESTREGRKSAEEKLEQAGLTDIIGQILKRQQNALPNPRQYRRDSEERQKELSRVGVQQILTQDRQDEIANPTEMADKMVASANPEVPSDQLDSVASELAVTLGDQHALLGKLTEAYDKYRQSLVDLDIDQKSLVQQTEAFSTFLNERLLWIPSSLPWHPRTPNHFARSLAWIGNPTSWIQTVQALGSSAIANLLTTLLAIALFLGIFLSRPKINRAFGRIEARINDPESDGIGLTIKALGLTILQALVWPLLPAYCGWLLIQPVDSTAFSRSVGAGLLDASLLFLALRFFRTLTARKGVALVHLSWDPEPVSAFRNHLYWFTWIVTLCTFVIGATEWFGNTEFRHSLGRAAFVISMSALTLFLFMILKPDHKVLRGYLARTQDSWLWRLRMLWFPAAIAAPAILIYLAARGYYDTALRLSEKYFITAEIFLIGILLYHILLRWVLIAHRRLAWKETREKAEEKAEPGEVEAVALDGEGQPIAKPEMPRVSLEEIGEQTRHIIKLFVIVSLVLGLWGLWAEVMPALQVLDDINLWERVSSEETPEWVTMKDIGVALILLVLTIAGAKNLPSVLEIAILQRLPMDAGARYALRSTCQYLVVGIGGVALFKAIGFAWSQVQWLIAALSVGLGFGLQEIVANFISGLIILYERPIRVGDVVTVAGTTGAVSRIRIRATTITDWDRKEFVVPNKEFITGKLLNWTLSDTTNRIVITIGVAYGSDTDRAREILHRIASEHPLIMKEPAPVATFEGFGDNSLTILLRCYLPDLSKRLGVITELHTAIDHAFKEARIEIAFPQRDLHIRSAQPIVELGKSLRKSETPYETS